jgi:hypothetical protein
MPPGFASGTVRLTPPPDLPPPGPERQLDREETRQVFKPFKRNRPASPSTSGDVMLLDMRARPGFDKAPLSHVAAVADFLEDGGVHWSELAARHGLTPSVGCWDAMIRLLRRVAWAHPPAAAINLDDPANSAIIGNVQLLLQVGTAGGGSASRSESAMSTIAIALEMIRDPCLNIPAACVRHGAPIGHLGSGRKSARERCERTVEALREHVPGDDAWGVLTREWAAPLDKATVKGLQHRCRVAISIAARALHAAGGDVEAAAEELRPEGEEEAAAAAPTTATAFDDPFLLRVQAALREEAHSRMAIEGSPQQHPREGADEAAAAATKAWREAPTATGKLLTRSGVPAQRVTGAVISLRTIAVAVDMARARDAGEEFDLHAAAVRHGIVAAGVSAGRNRKGMTERITPVAERIRALGLLAFAGEAAAEGVAMEEEKYPIDDEAWMDELKRRVITTAHWRATTDKFPPHTLLKAAVDLCGHVLPDIGAACVRHGISLDKCSVSTATCLRQASAPRGGGARTMRTHGARPPTCMSPTHPPPLARGRCASGSARSSCSRCRPRRCSCRRPRRTRATAPCSPRCGCG